MKRRTFIAGLGSAAAWPVVVRGQQRNGLRHLGAFNDPQQTLPCISLEHGEMGINSAWATT